MVRLNLDFPNFTNSTLIAVNLMTWTGVTATGEPGYAAWDLFHADDSDTVRRSIFLFFLD